jgi:hypothetical protein
MSKSDFLAAQPDHSVPVVERTITDVRTSGRDTNAHEFLQGPKPSGPLATEQTGEGVTSSVISK